jgi:integrase
VERQERGWPESPYVFISERGTPIEPRNLIRQFKILLAKAGISQETWFHDLRHSCATLLIAQGVHPRAIMEILGHSDIRLTMNIYGHVLPSVSRDAVVQLDALLGPTTEESGRRSEESTEISESGRRIRAQEPADRSGEAAEEAADSDG